MTSFANKINCGVSLRESEDLARRGCPKIMSQVLERFVTHHTRMSGNCLTLRRGGVEKLNSLHDSIFGRPQKDTTI